MLRFKLLCVGDIIDRRFISMPAMPLSSTIVTVDHRRFRILQTFMIESVDHVELVLEPLTLSIPFIS